MAGADAVSAPDFSEAAESLLDHLAGCEFRIGAAEHLRVQRLLASLAAKGGLPLRTAELKLWIRPLVCRSPREQERFDVEFRQWLLARGEAESERRQSEQEFHQDAPALGRTHFWRYAILLAAIALAGLIAFHFRYLVRRPAASVATPSPGGQPTNFWALAALAGAVLMVAFVVYAVWRGRRARAFLVQRAANGATASGGIAVASTPAIFNSRLLSFAAQGFGIYRRLPSDRLDVGRSVCATAREGGRFVAVYAERPAAPEYLVLIDRGSPADLFAQYAAGIGARLEESNVALDAFYFDGIPHQCWSVRGFHPISMRALGERFPEHRLMVFSDGAGFFLPQGGEFAPWMETLHAWENRTLVTPNARDYWGTREAALAAAGWTVVPAQQDEVAAMARQAEPPPEAKGFVPGLLAWLDPHSTAWLRRTSPGESEIQELLDALRVSLGASAFRWLCACAAYPGVDWNVTLYLGANLKDAGQKPLLREDSFLALSRLPWFRYGVMPEWLRLRLMRETPREALDETRAALQTFFLTGSAASGAPALAVDQSNRGAMNWLARRLIRNRARMEEADDPLRDRTLVEFLSGANPAALPLPEGIAALFRRRGAKAEWLGHGALTWQWIFVAAAAQICVWELNSLTSANAPLFGMGALASGFLMMRGISATRVTALGILLSLGGCLIQIFASNPVSSGIAVLGLGCLLPATAWLVAEDNWPGLSNRREKTGRLLSGLALWSATAYIAALVSPLFPGWAGALLFGFSVVTVPKFELPGMLFFLSASGIAGAMALLAGFSPPAGAAVFCGAFLWLAFRTRRMVMTPVTLYLSAFLYWLIASVGMMALPRFIALSDLPVIAVALLLAAFWRRGVFDTLTLAAISAAFLCVAGGYSVGFLFPPVLIGITIARCGQPYLDALGMRWAVSGPPKIFVRSRAEWTQNPVVFAGPSLAVWIALASLRGSLLPSANLPRPWLLLPASICAAVFAAALIPITYRVESKRAGAVSKPPPLDEYPQGWLERTVAAAGYSLWGIPSFLPRFRDNPFVRFHGYQALYFIGFYIATAVLAEGAGALARSVAGAGLLAMAASMAANVAIAANFVVWMAVTIQAARGKMTMLPLMGRLARRKIQPKASEAPFVPPGPAKPPDAPLVPQKPAKPQGRIYINVPGGNDAELTQLRASLEKAGFSVQSGGDIGFSELVNVDLLLVLSPPAAVSESGDDLVDRIRKNRTVIAAQELRVTAITFVHAGEVAPNPKIRNIQEFEALPNSANRNVQGFEAPLELRMPSVEGSEAVLNPKLANLHYYATPEDLATQATAMATAILGNRREQTFRPL